MVTQSGVAGAVDGATGARSCHEFGLDPVRTDGHDTIVIDDYGPWDD